MTIQKVQISSALIMIIVDRKTAASPPSDAAARLREGGSLLARLCSLVTALGLEEGSDETRPHVEEYVGWLQVPPPPSKPPPRCRCRCSPLRPAACCSRFSVPPLGLPPSLPSRAAAVCLRLPAPALI